jgi:hypothetical protein
MLNSLARAGSMEMYWTLTKEQMMLLLELNTTVATCQLSGTDFRWIAKLCGDSMEFWFCPELFCTPRCNIDPQDHLTDKGDAQQWDSEKVSWARERRSL